MPVLVQNRRMRNRHIAIDLKVATGRPQLCSKCRVEHSSKTLHARSNQEGEVTVSQGVYDLWAAAGLGAWKLVGTVDEPLRRGAISHG